MSSRRSIPPALVAVAALTMACGSTPAPPPKEPEPTPVVEAAPLPKKPKKKACKSLEARCEASAETRAKIAGTSLVFRPATGWIYAEGEGISLAEHAPAGPALGIVTFDAPDPKVEATNRDGALEAVARELGVTPPKKKVSWKKPADVKEVSGLKVSLWQLEGAVRAEKKGPALLFVAALPDGKALLGMGFVPDDDESGADAAILESIESLTESSGTEP